MMKALFPTTGGMAASFNNAISAWLLGGVLLSGLASSVFGASFELHHAIERGDHGEWRRLIEAGGDLSLRDADGNTPLHLAAIHGHAESVRVLLEKGADANAINTAGATALLYGVTDVAIVEALLRFDADPNIKSKRGMTPLLAAVSRGQSYEIAKRLVDAGADVHVNREGPWDGGALYRSIQSGDPRTIDLMFKLGVQIEATGKSYSPLHAASMLGDLATVKRLVALGADLNYSDDGWGDAPGHALNWAMWSENHDVAAYLIDQGADISFATTGGNPTPPMVWAGFGQTTDSGIARKLVEKGLDVNTKNEMGESALSYALMNGRNTELVRYLKSVGAREQTQSRTVKAIPSNLVPTDREKRSTMIRSAVQRALRLMQHSSSQFLNRRDACASCHHQFHPALAYGMARERGLKVDELLLGQQLQVQIQNMTEMGGDNALELSFNGFSGGKGLAALKALAYQEDSTVLNDVRFLRETQTYDGSWKSYGRAPMDEPSGIQLTAWSIAGLRAYSRVGEERATKRSLERAMNWLRNEEPASLTQQNAKVLGLHWGGESRLRLEPQLHTLLQAQRPDGGWAQLPSLTSDAWATGQTLYALFQVGKLSTDDPAYRRGVDFLLRTQFEDGSWWIKRRAWPFQPHFDSGFPHGRDQWISVAGTAWATMALLATIPTQYEVSELATGQELVAWWKASREEEKEIGRVRDLDSKSRRVDFERHIQPILERSCVSCHSGDRPKGGYRVTSREHLLGGGQSGRPTIQPGKGDNSPVVQFVLDQVEDLEMPPLHKRDTYPALSEEEADRLRRWIDQGAAWPEGVDLVD